MLDTIKAGTAPTVLDDWQLSVPQAVPCGVQAAEPGEQARACGGTHLRLARNAPLLQSQDILGALLREVNSAEDSLLTARSGGWAGPVRLQGRGIVPWCACMSRWHGTTVQPARHAAVLCYQPSSWAPCFPPRCRRHRDSPQR